MQVRPFHFVALAVGGGVVVALAAPAPSQAGASTTARYTVDAATVSGMAAMGAGGGGGLGAILGAMRGGAPQAVKQLELRLGSGRAATGAPRGEHFMPAAAGLGPSVELLTPARVRDDGPRESQPMPQAQMPKGRLLLFWGCGETAGPGQPVVIDFSKMAQGQVPPGLYANISLPEEWRIDAANSTTYGEWPHGRDNKTVPANASLLGARKVTSTYAPEINFTLADDFMPALQPTSQNMPSGATMLSWNGLPRATGYYAWVMGGQPDRNGEMRDMVWWTSSATQAFGGPMTDWLSPAAVARLVAAKNVLPPTQTNCAIPKEVKQAGGEMLMTQLFAYGPQADFSHPARPANAPASWKPDWIARVRYKANAMIMLGMPQMGDFGGEDADTDGAESGSASSAPALPPCKGGIAGRIARAAGLCR